jgi:DNA-binding LacI/PurR family transcriptional regulator/DNA-binding transcriptional regulator YhcF (GntR family)
MATARKQGMKLKIDPRSPLPIYHQIAAQVRGLIEGGKLRPRERLPAEMDVSKALGISPMTARQAYTRLVEDGLLYRRHGKGTFVSENPCPRKPDSFPKVGRDFGVLLFNLQALLTEASPDGVAPLQASAFVSELILRLELACAERGVNLHLLSANGKSLGSANNAVVEELLAHRRMDGLLLAGTPLGKADIDRLVALGMPIVSIDGDYGRREIPAVLPDDQAFAALAVKHLVACGHERILLATGPLRFGLGAGAMLRRGGRMRDAFFAALAAAGLRRRSCRHLECELDILAVAASVKAALAVPAGRRPQAVITDGDTVALGAAQAIGPRAFGLRQPATEDGVPILNFADSPRSPFVFAVKPIAAMAEAAVEILARARRDIKTSGTRIIPIAVRP